MFTEAAPLVLPKQETLVCDAAVRVNVQVAVTVKIGLLPVKLLPPGVISKGVVSLRFQLFVLQIEANKAAFVPDFMPVYILLSA